MMPQPTISSRSGMPSSSRSPAEARIGGPPGMPGSRTGLEEAGPPWGARARRDDGPLERDGRAAVGALDAQHVRLRELRHAGDDLDLALLREAREPVREPRDDRLLPRPEPVDVDLRLAERDALALGLLGLGDDPRDVQQRLGRDAADVEAHAAEALVALDQDDLQTEVGGAEGGGVAARAGAEDDDVGVVVGGALHRRRGDRGPRPPPAPVPPPAGPRASGAPPPSSPDGPAPSPPAPAPSSVRISVPSDTVSPTDTFSSATLPAVGDGPSIVALSDSSVMSGSSSAAGAPGWTIPSMTGTPEKSPMSGTWTSTVSDAPAPPSPAGSAVASWTTRSSAPPPSPAAPSPAAPSSVRMTVPSETVSPTDTLSSPTVPAAGDGTSIVALSDSSVTRGPSSATLCPGEPTAPWRARGGRAGSPRRPCRRGTP